MAVSGLLQVVPAQPTGLQSTERGERCRRCFSSSVRQTAPGGLFKALYYAGLNVSGMGAKESQRGGRWAEHLTPAISANSHESMATTPALQRGNLEVREPPCVKPSPLELECGRSFVELTSHPD
jgi:hypothetical protein